MTILCPAEFAEAVEFAAAADDALEAAIATADDEKRRQELESKRGQGMRSLLRCIGRRAASDAQDNAKPYFPDDSEIVYPDADGVNSVRRKVSSFMGYGLPIRETFISADFAAFSFFFEETWMDPITRQRVSVMDKCWYIFRDGTPMEEIEEMNEEELDEAANSEGVVRTYARDDAKKAMADGYPVLEGMRARKGMCGGIIYHADCSKEVAAPYGSWSTHT